MSLASKKTTQQKWQTLIKNFHQSPLPIDAYVRHHQIGKTTIYKWSKRLNMPLKKEPLSFLDVSVPTAASPSPTIFMVEVHFPRGHHLKMPLGWEHVLELVQTMA